MSEKANQGIPLPSKTPPTACGLRSCCPLQGRWGLLLWASLVIGIAYVQWPMVKGLFYRFADVKAPVSSVEWRSSFDAAVADSARTGKPILADFSASWCPPCQVMKHEVWPDAAVTRAVNVGYVPLLVDVDDSQGAEIAQRYGVRGIPAVLILSANGQVLRTGSYMSKGDMLEFLKPST